jgi:hypothetical protein
MTVHTDPAVERAMLLFNKHVANRDDLAEDRRRVEAEVIAAKSEQLIPLRMLLAQLQDMEVVVNHSDFRDSKAPPQPLRSEEGPSSPSWGPGPSIFLNHPGTLEIAIPNAQDIEKLGVVVLNLSHKNPHSSLLQGPFQTMGAACEALAEFIALQTVSVGRRPGVAVAIETPSG